MNDSPPASGPIWEPPSPEELQAMLPQYEISGFLGRGGMGAVYRARQVRLDREVAIKVLPETLTRGGDDELKFAERFELEAQAMAKFNHPSIVSVFDFGETSEGQLYFVMEFVEGMDIHQYLNENGGSISQEYALSITAHVLDALEYAHARGIIHRDIKPANILLNTEGQVKIADFGLAKAMSDGGAYDKPALTMSNVALGTPDFVAPEALDGDAIPDHRADLYAVGVMLYQMLTGKIPRGQFPMPSEVLSDLDPRVDEIVQQAMQYDPADRYPTASTMREALDPVISAPISRMQTIESKSEPLADAPKEITPITKRPPNRSAAGAGKIYMIATVCVFIGALIYFFDQTKTDNEPVTSPPQAELAPATSGSEERTPPEEKSETRSDDHLDPFIEIEQEAKEQSAHSAAAVSPSSSDTVEPTSDPTRATTESPYENSLGMRFVPVSITGGPSDEKLILFSIWEARVSDYRSFTDSNPQINLRKIPFAQDDSHAAIGISYDYAVAFCEWLTRSETEKGNLADGQHYRLPTDHEWSCAVGIGELEDPGATPASKDKALERNFPWGDTWPPPNGVANWFGSENAGLGVFGVPKDHMQNYSDDYRFTAPVDSMGVGKFGLYHTAGNAWEWTSDWSDETRTRRTSRSLGWSFIPNIFVMSSRGITPTNANNYAMGFRAVLDLNQDASENGSKTVAISRPQDSVRMADSEPAAVREVTTSNSKLASFASLESPYENSLGMRFSPVPIIGGPSDGKLILFSIWETRVKDFEAFKREHPEIQLRSPEFEQEDSHPAVYISYNNAVAFCEWLTESEIAKGNLAVGQRYRLPTDHEWSCAIGIGELEDPDATPASKDRGLDRLWPWGDAWPPPNGTINCYGEENAGLGFNDKPKDHLRNYSDEYRFTAPVDTMGPGMFGLYHMSGNITEWTSDWNDESRTRRTLRSAGWLNVPGGFFLSSARGFPLETASGNALGFRAVLDLNRDTPKTETSSAAEEMPSNTPEKGTQEPNGVMVDAAPASPLAAVPGLEPRLTTYLQFRQKLIGDLSEKYLGGLQGRFEAAIASGDLALAKAFESEKTLVETLRESLLELDKDPFASISSASTLDPLPEGTPAGLSELRAIWIAEREKISSQLSSNLVQSLHALEVELTKAADLGNAEKVRDLKDSIERISATSSQASPIGPVPLSPENVPSIEPFENSLGMKFVPVQMGGSTILLSAYETTVENYRKFLRDDRDRTWPEPDYRLRDRHAATLMTWFDAAAFCEWLTKEERRNGTIGELDSYTLPSLLELQTAMGIVRSHNSATARTSYAKKYLWGDEWPIPRVVGNLFGEETLEEIKGNRSPIAGYNDGNPQVAEVGSFEPNELGIYDLIGNAWEFCSDWFNEDEISKVLFGGGWQSNEERTLRAGFRTYAEPTMRSTAYGFRVVLRKSNQNE